LGPTVGWNKGRLGINKRKSKRIREYNGIRKKRVLRERKIAESREGKSWELGVKKGNAKTSNTSMSNHGSGSRGVVDGVNGWPKKSL